MIRLASKSIEEEEDGVGLVTQINLKMIKKESTFSLFNDNM